MSWTANSATMGLETHFHKTSRFEFPQFRLRSLITCLLKELDSTDRNVDWKKVPASYGNAGFERISSADSAPELLLYDVCFLSYSSC